MVYCRARYFHKYYPHPAWEAAKEGAVRQVLTVETHDGPVPVADTDQGAIAILRPW